MFMKTNNQKRKVGYIIMKKKIIAIVCVVLMLVGSVGVAKAAGICPPHYYMPSYSYTIQDGEYFHQFEYFNFINGKKVYKTAECAVCCEIEIYEYECDICGDHMEMDDDDPNKMVHIDCHSLCGAGDVVVD